MRKTIYMLQAVMCLFLFQNAAWAEPWKIAVVPKGNLAQFWKTVEVGAHSAGRDLKCKIIWRGPRVDDDLQAQIRIVDLMIDKKVDAIVLAPIHHKKLVESVKRATRKGIHVVIFDSSIDGDAHRSMVATDNYAAGRLAGEHLRGLIDGHGKFILLRFARGSASTTKREQGFIDALQDADPGFMLFDEEYCGAMVGRCHRKATGLLKQFPDVSGIFSPNETTATGMLMALQDAESGRDIHFIGFDYNDQLIAGLQSGRVDALVIQNPFEMAYRSVATAVAILEGKPVPVQQPIKGVLVTRDNLMMPSIQKIISAESE